MKELVSGLNLTPQEAQARRDRLSFWVKFSAVAVVGIVIAPLIFTLLKATIALIVTGVLALATLSFAPVLSMKFANWKLKAIMDEARQNPIPTLENELMTRQGAIEEAKGHLVSSLGQVEGFITKAQDAARKYPDMAERWNDRIKKARALAEHKKRSYAEAVESVQEFAETVDRARTEWSLILAEAAMNKSMNAVSGDPMAQLKTRVALESVTDGMNRAFARLEVSLLDSVPSETDAIEVQAIEVSDGQPSLLSQINLANKVKVS